MGFWPFGGGKRQRASESTSQHTRQQSSQADLSENVQKLEQANTDTPASTNTLAKKEEGRSRRLSKIRTASNDKPLRSSTAPAVNPPSRRQSRNLQPSLEKPLYQHDPTSQSSLGPENFNVVHQAPTLHARRTENDSSMARRKSSKRKADDFAREREIRTMSTSPIPIPRRPTSFYDSGPLQRETRDIPGGFNRKLNRSSQVSLPMPQTLPDVTDVRHQNSFKIGTFAALSPRPTIKFDATSASARGKQPQRSYPIPRPPTVDEEDADKKRINELADELDAGGLRELMERDKRRREKKKETDRARLQRKLQKRADKQKEEEARKARTEEYVSNSAMAGLGIAASPSAQLRPAESHAGPSGRRTRPETDPFVDPVQPVRRLAPSRNPFDDEKDMDVMHVSEPEREPAIPVKSPLRNIQTDVSTVSQRPSQAALSPPVSPAPRPVDRQSMSQASILNREQTSEIPESASYDGRASDHSSQKLNSWTAFFRRGTRRKLSSSFQGRSTPSEFSNTSRESFARHGPPPIVTPRTFRRADSATPQRTMSKFREDLPELPISPPDSRMQSPDTTMPPSAGGLVAAVAASQPPQQPIEEGDRSAYTGSSPIPMNPRRQESDLEERMELDAPSNSRDVILSQSLASVDSEASWLSGRPLHRRSGASQRLRGSRSSLSRPMPGGFDGGLDLSRPAESPLAREFSPESPPEIEERDDEKWHQGLGRQATLIRQAARAKSKEGLLGETPAEQRRESSGDSDDESPEDADGNEVSLMRARSVEYKGHARQISAGSARLLDISRRGSQRSEDLLTKAGRSPSIDQLSKL